MDARGAAPMLISAANAETALQTAEKTALLKSSPESLSGITDCMEGLQNALCRAAKQPGDVAERLTGKRYTTARLRRICLHALLGIEERFIRECLASRLYIRPLAVKSGREDVLAAFAKSEFPLLIRRSDERRLSPTAQLCLEKDRLAKDMYRAVTGAYAEEKQLFTD